MALPNIIQQINSKLPLSGGNMSGNIVFNTGVLSQTASANEIILFASADKTTPSSKSCLAMRNENHTSEPGSFYIRSCYDTTSSVMKIMPNGTFTWCGNDVITSGGGTITGNLIVSSIQFSNKGLLQSSNDAQYKSFTITSENTWSDNVPFIVMRKIDATSGDKGSIYINAGNGNTYSRIALNADSSLSHDGRPIVSVTKWTSGNNWYRKYADGWIEQGGSFSSSTTINGTTTKITFTIPFTTSINILGGFVKSKHSSTYGQMWFQNGDTTLTGSVCSIICYNANGQVQHSISSGTCYWYACGY